MLQLFFFFQAEDGIRDGRVTGVQTCALPISIALAATALLPAGDRVLAWSLIDAAYLAGFRSEERRVGKECRSRGSPYHEKKKTTTNDQYLLEKMLEQLGTQQHSLPHNRAEAA